ncbi:uncharacterized protein CDV56_105963 [Aspergillus thermomutatus]|uniref:Uncharacterized protein n=1 Tax=Aspergillus thermomutatus TaxID=41047 RepID=A0A397GZU8_ASPTH|nr:uncharacterized protein CDV56_105963 [Aspergillus thermomutatus]RHZ55929.1 hypothetical protein CDV56_105963 [Aspergillus thermomutatus]
MPRRSSRAVPASAAAPAPAPKRRASDRISAASKTDAKRQRYNSTTAKKAVRSTARKSKYFEEEENEDSDPESAEEDSGSAYEDTNLSPASTEPDSEEPEALSTDEEKTKRSTTKNANPNGGRKTPGKRGARRDNENEEEDHPNEEIAASLKDKELWREGVSTGLGPGKEVFIKKPKARDPGNIPYQDHTLHPNTMLFLQDLAKHNDRQWLKAHDADYRASKKDWETFVESLSEKISEQDSTIPELPAKDLLTNVVPFTGSGLWNPEADKLALLREDIDHNSHRLKAVLRRPDMRREVFNGIPDDEKKSVQAFVSQNKESALKTKPKLERHFLALEQRFELSLQREKRLNISSLTGRFIDCFLCVETVDGKKRSRARVAGAIRIGSSRSHTQTSGVGSLGV